LHSRSDVLVDDERLNALTSAIIGAAIEVHRNLGPGLLESIYLACLQYELSERGMRFESQKAVPVVYKSTRLAALLRIDLLVEDSVVVEVKALDCVLPVYQAQVLTYVARPRRPPHSGGVRPSRDWSRGLAGRQGPEPSVSPCLRVKSVSSVTSAPSQSRWPRSESPISTRRSGKYSRHRSVTVAAMSSRQVSSRGYQGFILASMTIGGVYDR